MLAPGHIRMMLCPLVGRSTCTSTRVPYSSKFLQHKTLVICSNSQKWLIFVAKISWLLQNFVRPRPFANCNCAHIHVRIAPRTHNIIIFINHKIHENSILLYRENVELYGIYKHEHLLRDSTQSKERQTPRETKSCGSLPQNKPEGSNQWRSDIHVAW